MEGKIWAARAKYEASFGTPSDPFERIRVKHKVKENRARVLISGLLRELKAQLEKRGYLEQKGGIFEE